jgi:hypothetical protein
MEEKRLEKILGIIPYATLDGKQNLNVVFLENCILIGTDKTMDKISVTAPVGMWPASGATIDSTSPKDQLSSFIRKKEGNVDKADIKLILSHDKEAFIIDKKEIKQIDFEDSAYNGYKKMNIIGVKNVSILVYCEYAEILNEYKSLIDQFMKNAI